MKNILFILLFLSISCNSRKKEQIKFDKETEKLKFITSLYRKDSLLSKKVYFVTGLDGCGACLEYTVKYIEKQIDNKDMYFIISGQSKVQLRSKFSQSTISNKNFLFDTVQVALKQGLVQMAHPRVLLCKHGKVYDIKDIDYINADSIFNYVNKTLAK